MTLREAMRTSGMTPPNRIMPCVEYGRIGETTAAFVSVFDTENSNGPRYGYAVWMREGFLAQQTAPKWRTEKAAVEAVENLWGPVNWYAKTPEPRC